MAYVNRTCDIPKKEIFDGLHKHFFDDENTKFPFMEILKKEIFDGLYKQFWR